MIYYQFTFLADDFHLIFFSQHGVCFVLLVLVLVMVVSGGAKSVVFCFVCSFIGQFLQTVCFGIRFLFLFVLFELYLHFARIYTFFGFVFV